MKKENKYERMPKDFVKLFNRYVNEILHENVEETERKASEIYKRYYDKTPKIGGGDNPMADNLYEFMTCVSYFEATNNRINIDSMDTLVGWMMEKNKAAGKLINLNKKFWCKMMRKVFSGMIKKTNKHLEKGEWGNTWRIEDHTDEYSEGFAYTLYGCPLLAFAKANGYLDIMPRFCSIDHETANLFHGRLIRHETEASGGSCCDYWFVGDKSESAAKYADLPKK